VHDKPKEIENALHILLAISKNKQTQIRYCDQRCFKPMIGWATKVHQTLTSMGTKDVDDIIKIVNEMKTCVGNCCNKNGVLLSKVLLYFIILF
jgi:hypothetical protein